MTETLERNYGKSSIRWFLSNYVRSKWILVLSALIFMAIEGSTLGFISYSVKELFDTVFLPQDKSSVLIVAILIFVILKLPF